ncbi:MAG: VOC family protein [Deltaproteobacteria bacterium]|nr:VOC family protein [Deltaproteobacteria bacterium]
MVSKHNISPCLWFDTRAEEAANFYVSIFPNSEIANVSRFGKEGFEFHGQPEGSAMSVSFRLDGLPFTALNGRPQFNFTEAVSFQVFCDTQAEIDHFWTRLTEGGAESQCGWLKDKFGVSWQIIPSILPKMLVDPDPRKTQRVTMAFLPMKKLDIATIVRAYEGL